MFTYASDPTEETGQCHLFHLRDDLEHFEMIRLMREAREWCAGRFGPSGHANRCYIGVLDSIWIRSDEDAFEFRLRWC